MFGRASRLDGHLRTPIFRNTIETCGISQRNFLVQQHLLFFSSSAMYKQGLAVFESVSHTGRPTVGMC